MNDINHEPAADAADGSAAATDVPSRHEVVPSGSHLQEDETGMDPAGETADNESSEPLTFGRRMRRARLAKNWTQPSLARRMIEIGAKRRGIAQFPALMIMISKWENDRKGISQYSLHVLAEALEVKPEYFGKPIDPDFCY